MQWSQRPTKSRTALRQVQKPKISVNGHQRVATTIKLRATQQCKEDQRVQFTFKLVQALVYYSTYKFMNKSINWRMVSCDLEVLVVMRGHCLTRHTTSKGRDLSS